MPNRSPFRSNVARRAPLLWALGVLCFAGCDALTGPSELERSIALEQRAITAYAAEVPRIDTLAGAFADAWSRANEHRDLAVYRSDLSAHAVVAGKALVAALTAMPAPSAEIKALHDPLVAAYGDVVAALETFTAAPSDTPFASAYAPVLAAFESLRAVESTYRRGIETWYAKNRTTLVAARAAPDAEPPTPPRTEGDR